MRLCYPALPLWPQAPKLCNAAGVAAADAACGGAFKAQLPAQARICEACRGTGELKKCSGCMAVFFCSQECTRARWREHKRSCKPTAAARQAAQQAAAPAAGEPA